MAVVSVANPIFAFICISFTLSRAIKGESNSMFALISSMISLCISRIPACYLFSNFFGLNDIWMRIPVG